jgi:NarL family two-component system sensor histidine kinase YdfH
MDKSSTVINTDKETRSFFWFLTLILVGVSVWLIIVETELREPQRLIPFCILMTVHILMHWMLRKFSTRPGWTLFYMIVQGLLAMGLIFIARNIGLTFGLSMALIGEAIGMFGLTGKGLLATLYYLALPLGFFVWISGFSQIGWWLIAILPMILFVAIYVELYTRQVKANKRAQELLNELEAANQQLTEYAAQVEDLTIAAERQRMARELHDTLSQGLAGMILQLEAADANLSNKPEKSRQIIQQTMQSARQTLADARSAIDNLRKSQPSGCEAALQRIVLEFTSKTNIPCELHCEFSQDLPEPVMDAIIKITTEALLNISRHANATRISLHAGVKEHELQFKISDNGSGFNPSSVPESGHYGLIGMEERVKLVGGKIKITSQPDQGTTITLRVPLP